MATQWDAVIKKIESILKANLNYAEVQIIGGLHEYLNGGVGQAIVKDYLILLSRPEGESQSTEARISWFHRRRFEVAIAIIVKTDPTTVNRMLKGKKTLFDVQDDIFRILEHNNLGGLCDNKAGQNFESGWHQVPIENKAFTCYMTVYTSIKTERTVN